VDPLNYMAIDLQSKGYRAMSLDLIDDF